MFDGSRLRDLMAAQGVSQSELARRVGVSQTTIAKLVLGKGYGSRYLHRIARTLGTSAAYLDGETNDPDENAPPPAAPPMVQMVTLQVALPSEAALAAMYEAQLRVFGDLHGAELARELARRLPSALARLQGAELYEETVADPVEGVDEQPDERARPELRRAQRR